MLALLVPGLAHATTLAVLPLGQGVKGEAYEGLGEALAGMIVSDLAGAEGLTLVERQRLEALLSELELGKTGFLDPKTAGKMGRGLGAEMVLVGTFTVVEGTLALDARIVRVESGEVLEGATASGTIADFVSVEKDLVEAILPKLEARLDSKSRRLFYTNVPTEDWDAFTAYSRGQAKASAGEIEAAKKAFQEALSRDPEFVNAAEGLARLQSLVAETRAADAQVRTDRYSRAEQAALEALPDLRRRKKGSPWTAEQLVDASLRFTVLFNRQRDCDRYDEMIAYLDAVGWKPEAHADSLPRWTVGVRTRAETLGIEAWDKGVRHPSRAVYLRVSEREQRLWGDTARFLFHGAEDGSPRYDHHGVLSSLMSCHPEPRRAKELALWRTRMRQHGVGSSRPGRTGLTLFEMLTIVEAWSDADDGRLTGSSEKSLAALLAAYPDPESKGHAFVLRAAEGIANRVDHQDRWHTGKLGLDEPTIRARLEAMVSGTAPFDKEGQPWCAAGWEQTFQPQARRHLDNWNDSIEDRSSTFLDVHRSAKIVRTAMEMGCYEGVPARVKTWEQAATFARETTAQHHPTLFDATRCRSNLDMITSMLAYPPPDGGSGKWTFNLYNSLLTSIQNRCLVEIP